MASEVWRGFSDEDLQRIKTGHPESTNGIHGKQTHALMKEATGFNRQRQRMGRKIPSNSSSSYSTSSSSQEDLTPEQCLSKFKMVDSKTPCANVTGNKGHGEPAVLKVSEETNTFRILEKSDQDMKCADNDKIEGNGDKHLLSEKVEENTNENLPGSNFSEVQVLKKDKPILEQFEQYQKRMEHENAKRKALIAKAIADRKKRTQAETIKLSRIQTELGHLDHMLSADVAILRKEIETASMEFSEAQKRYDKIEKEFVEVKMNLFQKMERKERLTEHLCFIIEENEVRKARKLEELMQELEMESLYNECLANGMTSVLPQLCALNNVSYQACSTIKPPCSPPATQDLSFPNETLAEKAVTVSDESNPVNTNDLIVSQDESQSVLEGSIKQNEEDHQDMEVNKVLENTAAVHLVESNCHSENDRESLANTSSGASSSSEENACT